MKPFYVVFGIIIALVGVTILYLYVANPQEPSPTYKYSFNCDNSAKTGQCTETKTTTIVEKSAFASQPVILLIIEGICVTIIGCAIFWHGLDIELEV
jgi:hypothetical protein